MATDLCYNLTGQVQQCQPEFENVAARASVETSDTCGTPPEDFCVQTGATGFTKSCHVCDSTDPMKSHNASSMTDSLGSKSWWQSRSMHTGPVQFPNSVNITVRLGERPSRPSGGASLFILFPGPPYVVHAPLCSSCILIDDWLHNLLRVLVHVLWFMIRFV